MEVIYKVYSICLFQAISYCFGESGGGNHKIPVWVINTRLTNHRALSGSCLDLMRLDINTVLRSQKLRSAARAWTGEKGEHER